MWAFDWNITEWSFLCLWFGWRTIFIASGFRDWLWLAFFLNFSSVSTFYRKSIDRVLIKKEDIHRFKWWSFVKSLDVLWNLNFMLRLTSDHFKTPSHPVALISCSSQCFRSFFQSLTTCFDLCIGRLLMCMTFRSKLLWYIVALITKWDAALDAILILKNLISSFFLRFIAEGKII